MIRRLRGAPPALLAAILVLVVLGVVLVVNLGASDTGDKTTAKLLAAIAKIPVPSGATLVHRQVNPAHGDANAYVEVQYKLDSAQGTTALVLKTLEGGGCRVVDLQTGDVTPVSATSVNAQASPAAGSLSVLPPGLSGGGVDVMWKADRYYVAAHGGDIA